MRARGQKTREGAASAVRNRHDHRHRGQLLETHELLAADKRPGEKCGLGWLGVVCRTRHQRVACPVTSPLPLWSDVAACTRHGPYRVRDRPHRDVERRERLHACHDPGRATAQLAHLGTWTRRSRSRARSGHGMDPGLRPRGGGGRGHRHRQPRRLLPARTGRPHGPRRHRHRHDAQGSPFRHGVRLRHLPARAGLRRRGPRGQRPEEPAGLQREIPCHTLSPMYAPPGRGVAFGGTTRLSRRVRRRGTQEARREWAAQASSASDPTIPTCGS